MSPFFEKVTIQGRCRVHTSTALITASNPVFLNNIDLHFTLGNAKLLSISQLHSRVKSTQKAIPTQKTTMSKVNGKRTSELSKDATHRNISFFETGVLRV
jgi:hypothetical protein